MQGKQYRLDDQIITGYDDFFYTWEKNMAMGEHRIGNCFVSGDILIFGSWTQQKEGCLQLEFFERLKKLPAWDITQYYCTGANLRDVETGQPLSNFYDNRKYGESLIRINPSQTLEDGVFRLARYKISVEKTGEITWQWYNRQNNINCGGGFIESDILFLGPAQYDVHEIKSKKKWYQDLGELPKWNTTFAWSRHNLLHRVEPQAKTKPSFWQMNRKNTVFKKNTHSSEPLHHAGPDERITAFYGTGQKKTAWWHQRPIQWEKWVSRFSLLLRDSFRMTFLIVVFILKKTVDVLVFFINFVNKMILKKGKRL